MRERDIFLAALDLPPAERPAFLAAECVADAELRKRVDALLLAFAAAGSFLDGPPVNVGTTATFDPRTRSLQAEPVGEAGQVIAGRYKLVERIGEGGMGSVWMAEQTEPVKRKVAVKLIKAGLDSKTVLARFEAERQALALMDHPNIAKVLDGGVCSLPSPARGEGLGVRGSSPFFVMELVKGVPITEFCDERKLTPQQRLELFVPVCQAIQHAHQKGVIHRDIKPANVLVALYDDKPVPKVIDFGVAKATGPTLTEHTLNTGFGGVVGTPQYMSPEQATFNNLDIDTRSDVYSLGVLLYELLAGSPPFASAELKKRGLLEILRVVREEEPPKPSTKLSTADALPSLSASRGMEPKKLTGLLRNELDWIVMKALEKDRDRRYETANGFAADVTRYLSGEPVQAHPPTAAYRLRKFVRKNKGPVVAGSLILLAMLAGIAGTAFGLVKGKEREREAARADGERTAKERATEAATAATAAKEAEVAQRARAEAAYARTADVLDQLTTSVIGDSITSQKTVSAEQKKFLSEVLKHYRQVAGEVADDGKAQARVAAAAQRVGVIESSLGRREEGVAALRLASDVYTKLVAAPPTDGPAYRLELARARHGLGHLLRDLGRRPEAEAEYRAAIDLGKKLAADPPATPAQLTELVQCYTSLGVLLADLGRFADAEKEYRNALDVYRSLAVLLGPDHPNSWGVASAHDRLGATLLAEGKVSDAADQYRQALAIRERLAAKFPTTPVYRRDLATSHHNQGILFSQLGDMTGAMAAYRKAAELRERLVADFPVVPEYRRDLADTHSNLNLLLSRMGQPAEAEATLRKALAVQEGLVADFPAVPDYRADLARTYANLGVLFGNSDKLDAAAEQLRKGLSIQTRLVTDYPNVIDYRVSLALSRTRFVMLLARQGKLAEAVAEVAELRKLPGWDANQWYTFARIYSVASGKVADKKAEYADAAVEMLTKAVKAGYKDAAHMKRDADLDPLRDRDDFKKLLADLEAKFPPTREVLPPPRKE